MDNGIYVALTRELELFRDMDITSNNIANTNTTGYNAEHLLFNSYVTKDVNQGKTNPMTFAQDISSYRDTTPGSIRITGNQLDVAIKGDGFFMIDTPLGQRYTRDGNFQIDGSGTLTTSEGYAVLDSSSQHINFPDNTKTVQIGEAGNLKINGEDYGEIGLVRFDNPRLLERLSAKLFKSEVPGKPSEDIQVVQGALENANVQPVAEMTHMVSLSHSVADTDKFIEISYDLLRKASNAWAQQS